MRAHFLKLSLRALAGCEAPLRERALMRLGERVALIESASVLSWLPIDYLLSMSELSVELGGEAAARQVVLETMTLACGAPPWGRVVRATIAAFGLSPAAVARWSPPLYRLAFRGCGTMRVRDVSEHAATVVFERVPAICLARPSYLNALGYALEFFFVLTESGGEVELRSCDREQGRLEYLLRLRQDGE